MAVGDETVVAWTVPNTPFQRSPWALAYFILAVLDLVPELPGVSPAVVLVIGEATGLDSQSLDVVLFSRSLHHAQDMDAALREACRILKPGGRIAVLEPDPDGPFTPVMRYVDDETAVYAQAQAALDAAVAAGLLERGPALRYATKYRVGDAGWSVFLRRYAGSEAPTPAAEVTLELDSRGRITRLRGANGSQLKSLSIEPATIEHHMGVARQADWVLDLGPDAGEEGGELVVAGTPEEVAKCRTSRTAPYLASVLGTEPPRRRKRAGGRAQRVG